jgi:hypothetical protein
MNYAALLAAIREAFPASRLEPVTEGQLVAIRARHPGVPGSYLDFLAHVGAGRIGAMGFALYSGPCEPADFFDPATAAELSGVLFFGDDFGGWHGGFDTRAGWQIVGISSAAPEPVPERAGTIAEFVVQWLAERRPA